jgi:hypothetical protein
MWNSRVYGNALFLILLFALPVAAKIRMYGLNQKQDFGVYYPTLSGMVDVDNSICVSGNNKKKDKYYAVTISGLNDRSSSFWFANAKGSFPYTVKWRSSSGAEVTLSPGVMSQSFQIDSNRVLCQDLPSANWSKLILEVSDNSFHGVLPFAGSYSDELTVELDPI